MRRASIWKAAPATLLNPSTNSAPSLPARNPPLQTVWWPFDGAEIVAYSPSPIFLTDAKPLSTIGVGDMRESSANSAAITGVGNILAASYIAPQYDDFTRKLRRERCSDTTERR